MEQLAYAVLGGYLTLMAYGLGWKAGVTSKIASEMVKVTTILETEVKALSK